MNLKRYVKSDFFICSFIFLFLSSFFVLLQNISYTNLSNKSSFVSHNFSSCIEKKNANIVFQNEKDVDDLKINKMYFFNHNLNTKFDFKYLNELKDKLDKKKDSLENILHKNQNIYGFLIFLKVLINPLNISDIPYILDTYPKVLTYVNDPNLKCLMLLRVAQVQFCYGDNKGTIKTLDSIKVYPWNLYAQLIKKNIFPSVAIKTLH
ncbi:hypothetical protein [Buchnera aphidicola]|uniref:hypothetical protein n=1 Tax=Buchnera aphidicola TaxID=9 RepID=UPI002543A7DD|nr:hypothetical protein [Buchnera aphidicola]WII23682.1 hypothetical protein QCB51_00005 [Buchnera aphidicola (Sipha maydis)]